MIRQNIGSYPLENIKIKKNSDDNGRIVADRNVKMNSPKNPSEIKSIKKGPCKSKTLQK